MSIMNGSAGSTDIASAVPDRSGAQRAPLNSVFQDSVGQTTAQSPSAQQSLNGGSIANEQQQQ